jgi:hypothetical protein
MKLDAEYVRAILDYDPETGEFRWRWRDDVRKNENTRWAGKVAGTVTTNGYVNISIHCRQYLAHRLAWLIVNGEWPPEEIDHIDLDKTNNRIANLRLATRQENLRNVGLRKNNFTGVSGVHWCNYARKFIAQIRIDGKKNRIGSFDTLAEAAAARAAAEIHYFGKFRRSPCNQNSGVL